MKSYDWIQQRAEDLKGLNYQVYLPEVSTEQQLLRKTDAEYLSLMSLRIFRAGLKHSLVDSKWPRFEQVFGGFNPAYIASLSDEMLEAHMREPGLIKHWGKMKAMRDNAAWILHMRNEGSSIAELVAHYPVTEIVELWIQMKKQGSQLGGASAPSFLRMVGKDTFRLSEDVLVQLRAQGIIDQVKPITSQRDLRTIQCAFNQWYEESGGVPMAHISRMLSFT
ncbi:DNA-3-methyladenine glycosylase I [Bermanella marisrubri]|uniref:3-methyladenine DNA glycosylase n=1 Tax=Bermanella marisrubri TaxID=207949 RepID=Q1N6F1_9GAMM|nr:DNA-3-methyladenine glycosylase I [Bermanella marisrubri]EAT13641.1 hypothetical protein RED65_09624 [Oceanobacter sp. RED65] [Bermanella marisrubri]QIZ84427.1 DNA-3-methyladenine glycosylase I [Bermanella marisrubri]